MDSAANERWTSGSPSARKVVENPSRGREEAFQKLADSLPHLVWLSHPDGAVYWCNQRWFDYSGMAQDEVKEKGWKAIFDPQEFPEILTRWQQAVRIGGPFEMTFRLRGADDVYRPFLSRAIPLRDPHGNVTRWLGTNTEIDAEVRIRQELERNRLQLQEALAASQRLAAIVESSDDAIISKDLKGIIASWNSGAVRLFGYRPEEVIGRSILILIPPELQAEEPRILENLRNGRRIDHYETERLRKDGTRVKVSLTISPVRDSSGKIIGGSKIARDITEHLRMQEAIIESEKLAATGRMAAAIAHEINNPLAAVTNLAFLLSIDPSLSESGKACAELLLEEINRVSQVAKQSLSFFRDSAKPGEFDLCEVLDGVVSLYTPTLHVKKIRIEKRLPRGCVSFGSESEIRQVFANILRNAIDAIEQGGKIDLRIHTDGSGSHRVLVADTGRGIEPEILSRLFQPFVTNKGSAGNGLGLWVSRGIVEKHNGSIRVRSCTRPPRSGTVFLIRIPRGEDAATMSQNGLAGGLDAERVSLPLHSVPTLSF